MQTLLVGVGCGGVLGLLPGVAVWKPRAALAEARWPWAESAALSGRRRRGGGALGFWSVGAGRKPHSESADYAALGGAERLGGAGVAVWR